MVLSQNVSNAVDIGLDPASLATGSAKQSAQIDANDYLGLERFRFNAQIKMNATAPTANTTVEFYIARTLGDSAAGEISEDNAGTDEAAITVDQAQLVGTIVVDATGGKTYYAHFDVGLVPRKFSLIVKNNSGQALDSTASNHSLVGEFYGSRVQ